MSRVATAGLVALLAVGLWQGLVWATGVPAFILPGPDRVAEAFWVNRAVLAENALVTFGEVIAGLALGALIGVETALLMMMSRRARAFLTPVLVFNQAVPVFALAPVLTLWLGYGLWSKIVVTVLIVYFPLTWAFYDGLRQTDPNLIDLARVMGASKNRILLRLRIPAALPSLASGLRLATIYAPVGAIFGEWVGASKGLGYLMFLANGRAKVDLMFAALMVLALFTVALHALVSRFGRRLERRAKGIDQPPP